MKAVYCPKCFKVATQRETNYGTRHSCASCELWSWDGAPLVDKETHDLRQKAHELFDLLWRDGTMKRKEAYSRLSRELHIPLAECHFKMMDKKRLTKVITYLQSEDTKC